MTSTPTRIASQWDTAVSLPLEGGTLTDGNGKTSTIIWAALLTRTSFGIATDNPSFYDLSIDPDQAEVTYAEGSVSIKCSDGRSFEITYHRRKDND